VYKRQCLPDGITLTSVQDITDFTTANPNCTTIEGDVIIQGITNFEGLEQITAIEGTIICDNCTGFENFEGLNNLETVGGIEFIGGDEFEFSGLESLDTVTGSMNFFLADFNDFSGLGGVPVVQGDVIIDECTLYGFGYITLSFIGGSFILQNNSGLSNTQLIGLEQVEGDLIIQNNTELFLADGFFTLTEVGGDLKLINNPGLLGFAIPWNLPAVGGDILIEQMSGLSNLNFLGNLAEIDGSISLFDNSSLNDISGIENINPESISALQIAICPQLSECNVESVCGFLAIAPQFSQIGDNLTNCNTTDEIIQACTINSIHEEYVEEFSLRSQLVNDQIFVVSDELGNYTIYNTLGEQLTLLIDFKGSFNVSHLAAGMYVIRDNDKDQAIKFLKQ